MAKTFLQLVTAAMDELGFDAPTSLIGNTDPAAKRMVRAANKAGDELAKNQPPSMDLVKEYTFNLVAATQTYAVPSDFRYIMPSTQWDRTQRRSMLGSISSMEWQSLKAWTTSFGLNWRFRIKNRLFEIEQTVSNTDQIAYEYVSRNWVFPAATPTVLSQEEFLNDSDLTTFDDELFISSLKWRFSKLLGFEWQSMMIEHLAEKEQFFSREWGAPVISLDQRKPSEYDPLRYVNVPETGLG